MVRIQHPSDEGSTTESTTAATSATIAGSKRSRPSSSLDFKANMEHKDKLIVKHDDVSPAKNKPDQQQQSSGGSFTSNLMGMNPTRSRGSAGFIPPKPKLTTLTEVFNSGLSDEEMMEMIYGDPDLSAKFTESQREYQKQKEASASQQQYPSGSSSPAPRGAGGNRRPAGSSSYKKSTPIKSSKDRVELLKEDGIPYTQWAVLLLLLAFSLYQLYIWMQPPESNKNYRKVQYSDAEDDELVAKELEGAVAKAASAANKSSSKKAHRSNNKKKSSSMTIAAPSPQPKAVAVLPPKAASVNPATENISLVTNSHIPANDESGWMSVKKNAKIASTTTESKKETSKISTTAAPAVAATPEDAVTVHTSNSKKKKKNGSVATVAAKTSSAAIPVGEVVVAYKEVTPTFVSEPTIDVTSDEPTQVEIPPEPDIDVITINGIAAKDDIDNADEGETTVAESAVAKKKKIKKKKTKTDAEATAVVPQSDTVDADAALAQQLQNEENEMAAAEAAALTANGATTDITRELKATINGSSAVTNKDNGTATTAGTSVNNDDDWAPVTKKKKAGQSKPDDVVHQNTSVNSTEVGATNNEKVSTSKQNKDDDDDEDDEE